MSSIVMLSNGGDNAFRGATTCDRLILGTTDGTYVLTRISPETGWIPIRIGHAPGGLLKELRLERSPGFLRERSLPPHTRRRGTQHRRG